jgi:hypothetical protein
MNLLKHVLALPDGCQTETFFSEKVEIKIIANKDLIAGQMALNNKRSTQSANEVLLKIPVVVKVVVAFPISTTPAIHLTKQT